MIKFKHFRRRVDAHGAKHLAARGLSVQHKRPYVLRDRNGWEQNLIIPMLAQRVRMEKERRSLHGEGFPLHPHLHNGSSSQAMLFNLVLKLIEDDDVDALAGGIVTAGCPWPGPRATASLEVEDRTVFNERQAQPTSLDLLIEGSGGPPLFVEGKLVEPEFGGCSARRDGDCEGINPAAQHDLCPRHREGRTYWTQMEKLGFLTGRMLDSAFCPMDSHYQFFREVVFALVKGGHYVLLVHDDNPAFQRPDDTTRGLWPFLTGFVPVQHRHRVHRVTLRQVTEGIEATGRHGDWIDVFRQRYALDPVSCGPGEGVDVADALGDLPRPTAELIRQLWESPVRGGKQHQASEARSALRRISSLVISGGIERHDPRWKAIREHGRTLYYEMEPSSGSVSNG